MPVDMQKARELFLHAVGKLPPEQWEAYVAEACGGDAELAQVTGHLLKVHREAGSFLSQPAAVIGAEVPAVPVQERPGTVIGPYKLLQQIGEGGMGVVWMAEQTQPVQRKVALKIIKAGLDSKQVIARFEAERQALALMDHPNIAKVFDAGTIGEPSRVSDRFERSNTNGEPSRVSDRVEPADANGEPRGVSPRVQPSPDATRGLTPLGSPGRPYFVMELVKGEPITKYCDEHRLTPRQRLELFLPVCQAIQHAHQKGIIHRDIKASNVLIAPYDGKPVVKVIDFGIAKATGQRLTDKTLFTEFGAVVGTLEYMSPEQAELNNQDIDTRSDIYSLGVLLYELLTGTTPLDRTRLKQSAFAELLRIIREEEPSRPSARLSESKDSLPSISAQRQLEPAKLTLQVRGELDWIVMKALEKDRNRRYETANGFAMDVQRYLNDEPVQACPPSAAYRLRKFARRNKAALATAALLVLILLAAMGAVAGTIGWGIRNRAALEQEVAQDRANRQSQLEKEITILLGDVERQRAEIHARLTDPIKVCELMSNIDGWQIGLAKARSSWQTAKNLATSNADVLTSELAKRLQQVEVELQADETDWKIAKKLDDVRFVASAPRESEWNREEVTSNYQRFFRDLGFDWQSSSTAQIASTLQQKRLRYVLVGALDEWASFSSEDSENQARQFEVARLADPNPWRDQVRDQKNWKDIRDLEKLARQVDVRSQSPQILLLLTRGLSEKPDHEKELLCSELLRAALTHHPQDIWLHFTLGKVLRRSMLAVGCYQAVLALRPTSSLAHSNLATVLSTYNELAAFRHYEKALELNPRLAHAYHGQGYLLERKKDTDGAIRHYRKAIELKPNIWESHNNLGILLRKQGDHDAAFSHFQKAFEFNPEHATINVRFGYAVRDKGDIDGAISHFRKAVELNPAIYWYYRGLGDAVRDKGAIDGAIQHYRKAIELAPSGLYTHINLGNVLYRKKDFDGAIQHFRSVVSHVKSGGWPLAHMNLGLSLRNTGHFAEALKCVQLAHELGLNLQSNLEGFGVKECEWRYPTARFVRECERLVKLDQETSAILKGEIQPASPEEWIAYIDVCQKKKAYASAVQLWNQFFLKNPALADTPNASYRMRAARDAVLAAGDQGKDAGNLTDMERVAMRTRAYEWLRADLVSVSKHIAGKQPAGIIPFMNALPDWQESLDRSDVREEQKLAKLPKEERKRWQKLWTEVEQMWKLAEGMFKETNHVSGNVTLKERQPVHEVKLQAGTTYIIDLQSKAFDTFLRVEDTKGKKLAEIDDTEETFTTNSRLIFTPVADGMYRIVASAFQANGTGPHRVTDRDGPEVFEANGTGPYTLTIREFVK